MNPIISLTASALATENKDARAVAVIEAIRNGRWREAVENIRAEYQTKGKEAVADLKKRLPGVLPSGKFERRANAGLVAHSGLLCADLDNLGERLPGLRKQLEADPHAYAVFASPTLTGLKVWFCVPADVSLHAASFAAVQAHVRELCGVEIDPSCKDVARLCFVSFDPEAYLNRDAVELPPLTVEPKPQRVVSLSSEVDMNRRQRIATELLGRIEWTNPTHGYGTCPGRRLHTTGNGPRDCEIHLDGAPTIHCFHNHCSGLVEAANRELRSRVGKAEAAASVPRLKINGAVHEYLPANGEPAAENPDEVTFQRLAALSPADYDRQREAESEKLGIRVGTLDGEVAKRRPQIPSTNSSEVFPAVEPWTEPVNGPELAKAILDTFKKFIVADPGVLIAVTLWSMWTWVFDLFDVAVMIIITASTKRAGKTKLVSVMSRVVAKPFPVSSATPAGIFRTIELHHPTLLIDEVDAFLKGDEQLRGLINSGHTRDAAFHLGCVTHGDDWEPVRWSTWCPKVLSGIGKLAPTLEDRAVILTMRRRRKDEVVTRLKHADRFEDLRRQLARWAKDSEDALRKSDPKIPDALNDRAADNWTPLLAIADLIGGDWPKQARDATLKLAGDAEASSDDMVENLIRDIRKVFTADKLSSADLCQKLIELEGSGWADWDNGKGISKSKLARVLSPLGIHPDSVKLADNKTLKGYTRGQFKEVWSRYCPDSGTSKRNSGTEPVEQGPNSLFYNGTEVAGSVSENRVPTNKDGAGSVVPFSDSGFWPDGSPIPETPEDLPPVDENGQRIETAPDEEGVTV